MLVSVWQSLLALGFAGSALASEPLIAEPIFNRDLEIRQADSSKCNPNGYKSLNGMNFTTYCGQNNPFNDAQKPFMSPSMSDCMEHCSRYWGDGEGCFGVVWVEASGDCWIRNSTTSTKNLVQKDGHYSALVVQGNMDGFDTACPKEDKSVNTLPGVDGMKYTMNCGKVIGGFDTCFQNYPQPCWPNPYIGFYHTKTLEECLQICADQRPLCKAVSWNPDLKIGFANCWPKTGFPETLTSPGAKQGIIHSATITQIDPIDRTCPSSKTYRSQGTTNKNFELHCGQLNTGTNITSVHTQNITSCMDACAKSDKNCIGVVFDSSLAGGYKNCYLQNTTNTVSDSPSATYAALAASVSTGGGLNSGNNNAGEQSSGSASKAWIAGPVIGGVAALGIIAFAIFWWRRRKAAKAGQVAEKDGHEYGGAYGPAPAYSPTGHSQQHQQQQPYFDRAPVGELGSGEGAANELPATTKYAHEHKQAPTELP